MHFSRTDELRFQFRFTVVEEHSDDFDEILLQLVECIALRVRTGEAGDVADV